ncbi:MAG: hydrolase [Clostridiales Family XIII bacterium]|jgi:hypothetical protein|nr:hydrolase [Clostridiales Family XIII bacterium]
MYELVIQSGPKTIIKPSVEDGVAWETERRDMPGKLTFTVLADSANKFKEGNPVRFKANGKNVFYGFVFQKSRSADGRIKVLAYDQIRYLKNKDTYVFRNKTAAQIVKKLAKDYGLNLGGISGTKKKIKSLVEDNKTLLDMIQDALDLTMDSRKELYVLFDQFGKLRLKAAAAMRIDKLLINHDAAQDFEYNSSIDEDTYNVVKLIYNNSKKKTRDVYMAKSSKAINNWGRLQYFENLNDKKNGKKKAKALLKLKNRVTRTLSIKGAFGDIRVRAGCSILVAVKTDDIKQSGYLLVERVAHTFGKDTHTMDLTLKGGKYFDG